MNDPPHEFDLEQLRVDILLGTRLLRITSHAQTEAFKDGLLLADLKSVFDQGEIIELYPAENRALLHHTVPEINMPVHIVIEDTPDAGVIITTYIPDRRKWFADKRRRTKN